MKCECGFEFAGPGEFRNCESFLGQDKKWYNVCSACGNVFESETGKLVGKKAETGDK